MARVRLKFSPNVMDIWSRLLSHRVLLALYKVVNFTQLWDESRKPPSLFLSLGPLVDNNDLAAVCVGMLLLSPPYFTMSLVGMLVSDAAGISEGPADMWAQNLAAARAGCLGAVLVAGQSGEVGSEKDGETERERKWKRENVCSHNSDQLSGCTKRWPQKWLKPATCCVFLFTCCVMVCLHR